MMIKYVSADDWKGVYVNGLLVYQGHDVPHFEWGRLLQCAGVETDWTDNESDLAYALAEELGEFPEQWSA